MALFSKKGKAKKAEQAKHQVAAVDDKPTPAPYKHVPKHAASDSIANGRSVIPEEERKRIAFESQKRLNNAKNDLALGNAAMAQSIAFNAVHGTSFNPAQSASYNPLARRQSSGISVNNPDAPPMPSPPIHRLNSPPPKSTMPPNGSGYLPQPNPQLVPYHSAALGNAETQTARRDGGYMQSHEANSTYGSVTPSSSAHSRTASDETTTPDNGMLYMPRTSDFLSESSLTEELAKEPAFSHQSFSGDNVATDSAPREEQDRSERSNSGCFSRSSSTTEVQSCISSKSSKLVKKETRFEVPSEPVPAVREIHNAPQEQQLGPQADPPQSILSPAIASERQQSEPPRNSSQPARTSFPAPQTYQEPQSRYSQPPRQESLSDQEQRSRYSQPPGMSSPPPAQEAKPFSSQPRRNSTPVQHLSQLEPITSVGNQGSAPPPLSILEGLKVNSKGRILDEEGDPIGELFEGNIMDCVRQKANDHGEVLDEYGGVVGRVRTLTRWLEHLYPTPMMTPSEHRESSVSQIEQPLRYYASQQSEALANPLPAPLVQPEQPAVAPVDVSGGAMQIERDASEYSQAMPLNDPSEIFCPPLISPRSPKRHESPALSDNLPVPQKLPTPPRSARNSGEFALSEPTSTLRQESRPLSHLEALEKVMGTPKPQQQPRAAPPSATQRSMSDNSPPFSARAAARFVPDALSVPEEDPSRFAYKGEIPAQDGPVSNASLAPSRLNGTKSSRMPSFPSQTSTGGLPGGRPSFPLNVGQINLSSSGMPSRRITINGMPLSVPGPTRPGMNPRHSTNAPLVRSPLSSHETTPPDSEEGSEPAKSDDGKSAFSKFAHSRASSIKTTHSTYSTASKPLTYITHLGRVRVDADAPPPLPVPAGEASSQSAAAKPERTDSMKKKSKLSFWGRKKGKPVAAP